MMQMRLRLLYGGFLRGGKPWLERLDWHLLSFRSKATGETEVNRPVTGITSVRTHFKCPNRGSK
jgi:hypothetical protein